ncbi:MAG TPA: DNA methyltransferase [Candidatus Sumerlaeota bacterium]|nr:DNA methyltransferase [Candidatus Sumerlaeota bacterium]
MDNVLYYGDNMDVLRRYVKDESVDLVYLDPPFKSNQDYNVLFKEHDGTKAASQIKAFEDTWRWDESAAESFRMIRQAGGKVSDTMEAFRLVLGYSDMLAYLAMMAPRLVELHRVLKTTGSIYLHCDPTASHYLKILMDAVFSAEFFKNEIVWVRTNAHNFKSKYFGRVQDIILYYTKTDNYTWNHQYCPYSEEQLKRYKVEESTSRLYKAENLTITGTGSRNFEWRGSKPPLNRVWGYDKDKLEELLSNGFILLKRDGTPRLDGLKVYLDEMPGKLLTSVWADIVRIGNTSDERLGYPTQKPLALLERIIEASSNKGDVVLDPFCGCGTAVVAAEKLERRWIGIDITHLAINLIRTRMKDSFGKFAKFDVIGEPVSLPDAEQLANNDPYQFQWWALGLVGARPVEQKKGADKGIDGRIIFYDDPKEPARQIIISVKAGHVTVSHIRDLKGVLDRENAAIGVLISMQEPTKPMREEAASSGFYESPFMGKHYPRIQILTISEILEGRRIEFPESANVTFKKASKAHKKEEQTSF